jgi:formylmethanofuran dehydrogenase subunit E
MPYCLACGSMIDEYDSGYYARNMFCIPCYGAKMAEAQMTSCSKCGVRIRKDSARHWQGGIFCNYCASELERLEKRAKCEICKKTIESWEKALDMPDDKKAHEACARARRSIPSAVCSFCGAATARFRAYPDGKIACEKCDSGSYSGSDSGRRPLISAIISRIGAMIG